MRAERSPTSEPPPPDTAEEEEWRARLQGAVERSARQRAARSEHRRALTARRAAGLQARQAARLTRVYNSEFELP